MSAPAIGDRVRFAPHPGRPDKTLDGEVVRHRRDPRQSRSGLARANAAAAETRGVKGMGWLEVKCDVDGVTRSVRPSMAAVLPRDDAAAANRVFDNLAREMRDEGGKA